MPTMITWELALVWFTVAFVLGAGWTAGSCLISKLCR